MHNLLGLAHTQTLILKIPALYECKHKPKPNTKDEKPANSVAVFCLKHSKFLHLLSLKMLMSTMMFPFKHSSKRPEGGLCPPTSYTHSMVLT